MEKLKEKLDFKKLNEAIGTGNKILKLLYTLLIIVVVYSLTMLVKEWGILKIFLSVLSVLSPFFIGYVLAWLLNPVVNKLEDRGLKRTLSVFLVYLIVLVVVVLLVWAMVPPLITQISETSKNLSTFITENSNFLSDFVNRIDPHNSLGLKDIENEIYDSLLTYITTIGTNLPNTVISVVSAFVSGMGTLLIAFVIGFYMLFNFNGVTMHIKNLIPTRQKKTALTLMDKSSSILHEYIKGTLLVSALIFFTSLIGFSIIGLKSPLLFALICGITNLIPYVGPYIGAVPAVLVGFAQDPVVGILVLIWVIISQTLEGNFLTPMVMSRKLDIHPVTVIIMLLIFGHFFGIIGMILATPIAAIGKVFFEFFNEKYGIFVKSE